MNKTLEYIVSEKDSGIRIDRYIAEKDSVLSRSFIQKLISDGNITVNNAEIKASYNVHTNDIIKVNIVAPAIDIIPKSEDISLDIVFEDDDIIVVNKPAGMVVHPAPGNYTGTLVNAVISRLFSDDDDDSNIDSADVSLINPQRPGIVHRIDKGTSGLLVIAKTVNAYYGLVEQVSEHSMTRRYIAVICGIPKHDQGTIIAPIGRSSRNRKKMAVTPIRGREAITNFQILEKYSSFSLIEARLETGRTHQIRVHFAHIGHPVVGDPDYGGQKRALDLACSDNVIRAIENLSRQALHAQTLGFIHPATNEYMEFSCEIPDDMQELIDAMRLESKNL
jgi:23S rRNA pseudouridine1911/1915/1917 synthase